MACSFSVASWMWYIYFDWGLFEMRVLMRGYKLAMAVWQDVKALVMNPQAVVAGAALVRCQLSYCRDCTVMCMLPVLCLSRCV